jgi:hypothetical protein
MADLFGKPDPKPYVAPAPYYCYRCAGTASKKCRDCGARICRNHGSRCEKCGIAAMLKRGAERATERLLKKIKRANGGDQ